MIFLIGFASSTITLIPPTGDLSQNNGDFTFTLLSTENETITLAIDSISDGSGNSIIFSGFPESIEVVEGDSHVINVTYSVDDQFEFDFIETYTAVIEATGSVSNPLSKGINFEGSDFCEYGNSGELLISIKDVQVLEGGFGEDKEWFLFDSVEVEVQVQNKGNEDVEDIVLEWGLYNTQSGEWTIEIDEEDEFDLDEGDKETLTFTFTLDDSLDEDLEDLKKGDYIIYVRITGEIADGDDEGENTCSSDSETGKLITEKNFVVLSNIKVPEVAQCNSEVQILGDAWNIGSSDQDDVYVNIYSKELGIDEDVVVGDIDSFDSSDFEFSLSLPEDVEEKRYYLTLTVYDEDDDVYENGNDDKSVSTVTLNVKGGCAVAKASVNAVLESGGQAGKLMVVKATITNTGNKVAYYSLNVAGYTGWASSATLDKNALTLNAGDSAEVLLNFDVKKEALGTNIFYLEVLSGNELIVNQPVQVEITKKTWGITGNLISGDNKYIWGIGLLNLILIVLIIVIAVRIARK